MGGKKTSRNEITLLLGRTLFETRGSGMRRDVSVFLHPLSPRVSDIALFFILALNF
jgi:hypothetical protein